MDRLLREFQDALLTRRVASNFLNRKAIEFPTEEARKKYLHEHPDADPQNHTVKKDTEGQKDNGPSSFGDPKKYKATLKKQVEVGNKAKAFDRLYKQYDRVEHGYKTHDPDKAKEVAGKLHEEAKALHEGVKNAVEEAEDLLKKVKDHNPEGAPPEWRKAQDHRIKALEGSISKAKESLKDLGDKVHSKPDKSHEVRYLAEASKDATAALDSLYVDQGQFYMT